MLIGCSPMLTRISILISELETNVDRELENQIVVAASAAKAGGFIGTHQALLDLLRTVRTARASVMLSDNF
jgi:hypothetical protein